MKKGDQMDEHERDWLAQRFEERRPHLQAIAYRMLRPTSVRRSVDIDVKDDSGDGSAVPSSHSPRSLLGGASSRPRRESRTHAGTGAGWALTLGNGRKVKAIRNAPRPTAQEPM
ncbi:MAG: hypothetical protein E6G85_03305 [Alphaproteobacteria bacterium]|nr:MAG: hypothetical protein E6G85_03305 [Alphaproteobacteria bacterium]